jgi:hypothetical protein
MTRSAAETWARLGWVRAVRIWREGPSRWEAYCPGCDYQGSTEMLMETASTWAGAMAAACEHLADSHSTD